MDTTDFILRCWEYAGEPSDLDPLLTTGTNTPDNLDSSSDGVAHYLRIINTAQLVLFNWRTSAGRPIRFKKFFVNQNVKLGISESSRIVTAVTKQDDQTFQLASMPSWATEETLENAMLRLTYTNDSDETEEYDYMVMYAFENTSGTVNVYLKEDIDDTTLSGTTSFSVEFFFNHFMIDTTADMDGFHAPLRSTARNILKVTELENGAVLSRPGFKENLIDPYLRTGVPKEYYTLGDHLYFDSYIEDPTWFNVEYQRLPADLETMVDDIDIPDEWHHVLLLICSWLETKRLKDLEEDMALKSQINQLINQMRTDIEEDFIRQKTGGMFVQKESD